MLVSKCFIYHNGIIFEGSNDSSDYIQIKRTTVESLLNDMVVSRYVEYHLPTG